MKTNYKRIGIGLISIFIYFFGQLHATDLFSFFNIDINSIHPYVKIFYIIMVDISMISILLLLNYKTLEANMKDLKKNHKKYFSDCLKYWLISIVVMIMANFIIMTFFHGGIAGNEDTIRTVLKSNPLYIYISAVIFAPIVEELIFRQSFRNLFANSYIFIIFSSFVFGSLHVIGNFHSVVDLLYIIPYSAPGVAFAYMLVKTKNIYVSMGFHFMHNGLLVSLQILLMLVG